MTRWRPTIDRLDSSVIAYSPTRLSAVVPATNTFGDPFTISGRVFRLVPVCDLSPFCGLEAWSPGRRRVLVQAYDRDLNSGVTVASTTTDVDGMVSVRVPAEGRGSYRVAVLGVPWTGTGTRSVAGAAVSDYQDARTLLRVVRAGFVDRTAHRGQRVTARLRVRPANAVYLGRTTLQRRAVGRWVDVARISIVQGKGAFTFRARHRGVTRYRFLVPDAHYGQKQRWLSGVSTPAFRLVTR